MQLCTNKRELAVAFVFARILPVVIGTPQTSPRGVSIFASALSGMLDLLKSIAEVDFPFSPLYSICISFALEIFDGLPDAIALTNGVNLRMLSITSRYFSFEYLLCLGEEDEDVDPDDIFKGHERNYIIQKIVQGKLIIDIPNVIYQMSPTERLTILKALKEKKINCDYEELIVKLTESEKKYLFGGQYYVVQKRK